MRYYKQKLKTIIANIKIYSWNGAVTYHEFKQETLLYLE